MTQHSSPVSAARRPRWKSRLGVCIGGLLIVAVCVAIRSIGGSSSAQADGPLGAVARPAAPVPTPSGRTASAANRSAAPVQQGGTAKTEPRAKIMAQVNGVSITRDDLGNECLRHYGKEVLDSMLSKYLIAAECKRRGIMITRDEVDGEIRRMAERFNLPVEQWLKLLKQERGIKPVQYASDIIWPMLALRKLAGDRLNVTPEEVQQAYQAHYGPSVRCRLIACRDQKTADKVYDLAVNQRQEFGELAKQYSEDASASVKGVIPPIRHFGSFPELENTAFSLKNGEVSPPIRVAGQFIVLRRETEMAGASNVPYQQVRPQLEEIVREKKTRGVAAEIFQALQKASHVEVVLNNPEKSRALPGVAAVVDGAPITLREVAEACIDRHGEDVLEGTINRKLIELDCQRRNIQISEPEMDQEIARAASEMLPPTADGKPDVDGWLKATCEQQNISVDVYRYDAVWPSVALKKLVAGEVKVTEEDLTKGFDANFGPRVRCRAIVLTNPRRAQEVWEKARKNPTVENFGDLAEAYSVEPSSQALHGEVPPIQMNGGQPELEKEAFALKPGQLSGVIQVADKYVILLCEGLTQPEAVNREQVRDEIYKDIFEKKQRLAMGRYFEQLQNQATIDNFLAGTSTSPQKSAAENQKVIATRRQPNVPALRQIGPDEVQRPAGSVGARPGGTQMR